MSSNIQIINTEILQTLISENDTTKSFHLNSKDSEVCLNVPCIAGIDEAGRGPVLGPMVYSICYCPTEKEDSLKDIGSADSKSLTEEKRENIFNKICVEDYIGWEVEVISPSIISNCMLRRQKYSLNEISHNAAIVLIKRALEAGIRITDVFVDTVGPAEKYEAKLKSIYPELNITVSKKADSKFAVVGAASICAKVTRDICLKTWTFPEIPDGANNDLSWGSGYPTDPVTKKFLDNVDPIFGYPQIVRFSWSTAATILNESAITAEWEDEEIPKKTRSVKLYFQKQNESKVNNKHRYFKERNLTSVIEF